MGTIPPQALAMGWTNETMTVDMAIGHLIQHVVRLHTAHETQMLIVAQLRREIEQLTVASQPPPITPTPRKKRSSPRNP